MLRSLTILAALLLPCTGTAQLTCFANPAGESCGPTLAITFTPLGAAGNYDFQMTGSGLHPNSLAAFVWGAIPLNVTLPFGCPLLTDFVWGHSLMTDSAGTASWGRSWPHWATITFYMQMGSITTDASGNINSILTTNCKLAGCL
jgi:hypothetical protein